MPAAQAGARQQQEARRQSGGAEIASGGEQVGREVMGDGRWAVAQDPGSNLRKPRVSQPHRAAFGAPCNALCPSDKLALGHLARSLLWRPQVEFQQFLQCAQRSDNSANEEERI